MAVDQKITELTELTTVNVADILAIVDDVSGDPISWSAIYYRKQNVLW